MLMYYDARPTGFNGIWDMYAYEPLKGWYAFEAFRRLRRLGNHVRTELSAGLAKGEEVYAAAARCKSGASASRATRSSCGSRRSPSRSSSGRLRPAFRAR